MKKLLTLSFRERTLDECSLATDTVTIGRDSDCDVVVDSLAIAPRHLQIIPQGRHWLLQALDEHFPVHVNGELAIKHQLGNGDTIAFGKHVLLYTEEPLLNPDDAPEPGQAIWDNIVELSKGDTHSGSENDTPADPQTSPATDQPEAETGYLQVLSGAQVGRLLPLDRNIVRLGRKGQSQAVITRRDHGFFLSHLGGEIMPTVGNNPIGDSSHHLNDGVIIERAGTRLQFFVG